VAGDRLDQGQRHRHGRADSRCRRHTIVNPVCDNGPPKWSRHLVDAGGQFDPPLALIADAWSRTYRSRAVTFAPDGATRESRNGIQIVPDEVRSSWPAATRLPAIDSQPARALDEALDAIRTRYGPRTFDFVAMQLEYPTEPRPGDRDRVRAFSHAATRRWPRSSGRAQTQHRYDVGRLSCGRTWVNMRVTGDYRLLRPQRFSALFQTQQHPPGHEKSRD